MPYQDINGTEVEYIASFGGHNKAIGRLWKEAITDFLLTAARETRRDCQNLTFSLALGTQVRIEWDHRNGTVCARGSVGDERPAIEPHEVLVSHPSCSDTGVKSRLFDFVHGPRIVLVIYFPDLRPSQCDGSFIQVLYLWKSAKDRALHIAASYR
ncbi:hypothetical protein A3F39_00595 [Candidatus Berkelbacteria bacterium RIFCSPHIGHO2_12_FULL_50_11]|nr:MAG: hypothetical protein A3F39_00595 [Candidatus Berkelbacteria bacterium RIFCSPHIGHO2_12_FULL_50_11]